MVLWPQWAVFPLPTCALHVSLFISCFHPPHQVIWISSNHKRKEIILFSYKTHHEATSWAASAFIRWLGTKTRTASITAHPGGSLGMCRATWWLKSPWMTSTWSISSCSRDSSPWTTQVMRFMTRSSVCSKTWAETLQEADWGLIKLSAAEMQHWMFTFEKCFWFSGKSLFTFSGLFI